MSQTSWGQIASWAKNAGAKYPELVAAQWALESAWGSKVSGKFNFFGIKGKGTKGVQTKEFIDGKWITIQDEFQDFNSAEECITWLVDRWYKDYDNRYRGVNNAADRSAAARMLSSEGYATDPKYAEKLIELMEKNTVPSEGPGSPRQSLSSAARWYAGLKHQDDAYAYLESILTPQEVDEFFKRFRAGTAAPVKPKFPLNAPYFYQRDSKTGHGERSCQSSAIAMAVKYYHPMMIKDDDDYLNTVFRHGDTVSQVAQKKALDHYGVKASFHQNGNESTLTRLLDLGCPVPIGILHKGPVSNPSGGGHWITVTGYDDKYFYVSDPFGELDLINGGYPKAGPTDGKNQRYSRTNLMKRWIISGPSDGWYWSFEGESKR
jgi:hypothetical protein